MTRSRIIPLLICLAWLFVKPTCVTVFADDSQEQFFENRIRPILAQSCVHCHGNARAENGLRVDSRDALFRGGESGTFIDLGDIDRSLLIRAIAREADVSAMPPEKDKALRADQIEDMRQWLRDGAYWPESSAAMHSTEHWAFVAPRAAEPPMPNDAAWSTNLIDRYVRSAQESAGAVPASQADRVTLLRRATYDLTGLPPTIDEIREFESDPSDKAFENVIERLLHSKAYGQRWGRHWLDVVRYADTAGDTADFPVPTAWRYRDYVIDSFNKDKPYDQFLREQIAGDILARNATSPEQSAEQTIATGYVAISRRFGFDSENYHHLTIQDTIDTIGQSILGLSTGCARCHDHKFDPISMQDYYALYGIFDSSRYPFPGSEQKQRLRTLVPLVSGAEPSPLFRDYDNTIASLTHELSELKLPVPQASLRSLYDMDGDFEIQAPAAGGSNGVLVSPWLYSGKIAVTNAAQSPYQNLFPKGRVGASIAAGSDPYRIEQSVLSHPSQTHNDSVYINLDFRVDAVDRSIAGEHRVRLLREDAPDRGDLARVVIQGDTLQLISGDHVSSVPIPAKQWCNLQLHLDIAQQTIAGTLSTGASVCSIAEVQMPRDGQLTPARIVLDSNLQAGQSFAGIEYDNISVQREPLAAARESLPTRPDRVNVASQSSLEEQLKQRVGFDAGFEFQFENESPREPWGPGPNSVVKIRRESQSAYAAAIALGDRGIFLPNRAEYDGFGRTLPRSYQASDTEHVHATFEFRCESKERGGMGSWRFYVGHGPGPSPAVELFFNGDQFFRRSGDARDVVCDLKIGQWYQVQLAVDLKAKSYQGTIVSSEAQHAFEGSCAPEWDGVIDYTFIDSYGHIGGVRPSIEVDNYEVRNLAFPAPNEPARSSDAAQSQIEIAQIRDQLQTIKRRGEVATRELETLLTNGPVPMAYAMSDGTPHSVAIHKRGEPDQAGERVPRGFLRCLSPNDPSPELHGSGRLELAEWLTSRNNPLTARVMVNRIWQYHFGVGLVKTPNDFGVRGMRPTHPELLDQLAIYFMEHDWSVHAMHRLIMSSQTYQQSADASSPFAQQHGNDLYVHFPRRRLSAEEIRDSILFVSDTLDRTPATEHPFPSPIRWAYSQHGPYFGVYDHNRRSVYLMTQRLKRHPFLALFDGPDPNASTARRLPTTVPTQALYFLNDPFVHSKSETIATRVIAENKSIDEQIAAIYRTILSRDASPEEISDSIVFVSGYRNELNNGTNSIPEQQQQLRAMSALARTLFGSNEFIYLD